MHQNTRIFLSAALLLGTGFASGYLTRSRVRGGAELRLRVQPVQSDTFVLDRLDEADDWKMEESELLLSLSHLPH